MKKIRLFCSWTFFFLTVLIIDFEDSGFGKTGDLFFSFLTLDLVKHSMANISIGHLPMRSHPSLRPQELTV